MDHPAIPHHPLPDWWDEVMEDLSCKGESGFAEAMLMSLGHITNERGLLTMNSLKPFQAMQVARMMNRWCAV